MQILHTVIIYFADEWFIEKLAKMYSMPTSLQRTAWTYQGERAGYWKEFQTPTGTLHLVTVKVGTELMEAQNHMF